MSESKKFLIYTIWPNVYLIKAISGRLYKVLIGESFKSCEPHKMCTLCVLILTEKNLIHFDPFASLFQRTLEFCQNFTMRAPKDQKHENMIVTT